MRELSFLETNLEQTEEFGKCTSGGTRSSLCVLHLFLWADTVGPRWHPGWHTLCPRAGRRVGHGQKAGSPKGGILGVGAWVFMCVIGIFSFMLMEAWFYFTYRLWFRYGWVGKTRSYSFLESLVLFKPSLEVLLCAHTQKVSKGASRTNHCDWEKLRSNMWHYPQLQAFPSLPRTSFVTLQGRHHCHPHHRCGNLGSRGHRSGEDRIVSLSPVILSSIQWQPDLKSWLWQRGGEMGGRVSWVSNWTSFGKGSTEWSISDLLSQQGRCQS